MFPNKNGAALRAAAIYNNACVQEKSAKPNRDETSPEVLAAKRNALSTKVLLCGILSLAFSCSFYLSLLGVVFGLFEKRKEREYKNAFGSVESCSQVGRDLGAAGLVVGSILFALGCPMLFI